MKKSIVTLTMLCLVVICQFANAQSKVTEDRGVGPFTSIEADCGSNIKIHLSDVPGTIIKLETTDANSDDLKYIQTTVKGGTLKIIVDGKGSKKLKQIVNIYVPGNKLTAIKMCSGVSIECSGNLTADKIALTAKKESMIDITISAAKISCVADDKSSIDLKGIADYAKLNAKNKSHIGLKGMAVTKADVSANSSSNIDINVSKSLSANANEGSIIGCYGNPAKITTKMSDGGKINHN